MHKILVSQIRRAIKTVPSKVTEVAIDRLLSVISSLLPHLHCTVLRCPPVCDQWLQIDCCNLYKTNLLIV